jgi:hypothetical protein
LQRGTATLEPSSIQNRTLEPGGKRTKSSPGANAKRHLPIPDARIPEPASILLLLSGAVGLLARRRMSRNRLRDSKDSA